MREASHMNRTLLFSFEAGGWLTFAKETISIVSVEQSDSAMRQILESLQRGLNN